MTLNKGYLQMNTIASNYIKCPPKTFKTYQFIIDHAITVYDFLEMVVRGLGVSNEMQERE